MISPATAPRAGWSWTVEFDTAHEEGEEPRDAPVPGAPDQVDLNVTVEEGLSISGVQLAKTMGTAPALITFKVIPHSSFRA